MNDAGLVFMPQEQTKKNPSANAFYSLLKKRTHNICVPNNCTRSSVVNLFHCLTTKGLVLYSCH